MALHQPYFPRKPTAEDCHLRFGLTADGGTKPKFWEALRFVSLVPHSLPTDGRTRKDVSARVSPELDSGNLYLTAQLLSLRRTAKCQRVQVSQDELAEP